MVKRREYVKQPITIYAKRHPNDSVEIVVKHRSRPMRTIVLQPMRGIDQTQAAERVVDLLRSVNAGLILCQKRDMSRGPPIESDECDGGAPGDAADAETSEG